MTKPTPEQIEVAILWLNNNEGGGSERESCKLVAEWLDKLMLEDFLRTSAKNAGIPLRTLKTRLEEMG